MSDDYEQSERVGECSADSGQPPTAGDLPALLDVVRASVEALGRRVP